MLVIGREVRETSRKIENRKKKKGDVTVLEWLVRLMNVCYTAGRVPND